MSSIDVSSLISKIHTIKAPRYKILHGQRMKLQDFLSLSDEKKKELEQTFELEDQIWETSFPVYRDNKKVKTQEWSNIKSWDFSELDAELESLNKKWYSEMNPIKREIIGVKYHLAIETHFKDCPDKIQELKNKLNELEELLK